MLGRAAPGAPGPHRLVIGMASCSDLSAFGQPAVSPSVLTVRGNAMARDPRFDILFEPVRIGPKTARNRFYQVPHCTGMGRHWPTPSAFSRGVKAEGGWAVVCTEQCDIHQTGNITSQVRLWDEKDVAPLARTVDQIHSMAASPGSSWSITAIGCRTWNRATSRWRRRRDRPTASCPGPREPWTSPTFATCGAGIARRR